MASYTSSGLLVNMRSTRKRLIWAACSCIGIGLPPPPITEAHIYTDVGCFRLAPTMEARPRLSSHYIIRSRSLSTHIFKRLRSLDYGCSWSDEARDWATAL